MPLRADVVIAGVFLASCTTAAPAQSRATFGLAGQRDPPRTVPRFEQVGMASWYGDELRGQSTASGEAFDPDGISAAHPTLPLNSYAEVTALDTGRTILVRINDRGPYHSRRILDMSFGAARQLGLTGHGARPVRIVRVVPSVRDMKRLREGRRAADRPVLATALLENARARAAWRRPVTPSTVIPTGGGAVWLQIASFTSRSRAEAMARRLRAQISTLGAIHRVRLGPYFSASAVNAALAPLAAKGYPDIQITR